MNAKIYNNFQNFYNYTYLSEIIKSNYTFLENSIRLIEISAGFVEIGFPITKRTIRFQRFVYNKNDFLYNLKHVRHFDFYWLFLAKRLNETENLF